MKYKNIKITGHQRTGTHYIAALICTNFLNTEDYVKHYLNHKLPAIATNKHIAYVYTWRDFKTTSKSIFKMRARFGLQVDDYEKFLNTKYSDMWSNINFGTINVKDLKGNIRKADRISTYFRKINYKPKEWWSLYHNKWSSSMRNKSNIIKVSYNNLIDNFDEGMLEIATKLGVYSRTFNNIENKVGWYV